MSTSRFWTRHFWTIISPGIDGRRLKEAFRNEIVWFIRRRHRAITDGRESAEIEYVSRRLRTVVMDVNINIVSAVIEKDYHQSIWKLADDLHIPRMSIQCILTNERRMKRICSMWISHFLWAKDMKCYGSVCSKRLAQIFQHPDFLVQSLLTNPGFIITILK